MTEPEATTTSFAGTTTTVTKGEGVLRKSQTSLSRGGLAGAGLVVVAAIGGWLLWRRGRAPVGS